MNLFVYWEYDEWICTYTVLRTHGMHEKSERICEFETKIENILGRLPGA
jgi:hypothetical protein